MIGIQWKLTPQEREQAIAEGRRRQGVNEAKRLKGRNRGAEAGAEALRVHVLGAAGEMAVASYLGLKDQLYLEEQAVPGSCDLPGGIDVKTRARHYYDLLCQKDEVEGKKLVLVTIEARTIWIRGWIPSEQAIRADWWQEFVPGRGCYAVPQRELLPIDSLPIF